jgi:thioredoxin-dependent peroxiredoxin
MASISVGDRAPDFDATTFSGERFSLAEARSAGPVVVFFYPKDDSPICTLEACRFRDEYEQFTNHGATVVGISADSNASHESFSSTHRLPFPLLSDDDGKLRKAFGVPKTLGVLPGRVTYVIDRDGIVQLAFNSQLHGEQHVEEALDIVRKLAEERP